MNKTKGEFVQTNIYAITDSHQESRNLGLLLSGIYNFEKDNKTPFLVLDAGDLFKGIYDKNLSVNAYIKLKQLLPNAQILITVGNNDFGFTKQDFEFLKQTIRKFEQAGINVVCSNIIEIKTGQNANWVNQYKILKINGQKFLITGFCLNNSCAKNFGYNMLSPQEGLTKLLGKITEPYDKILLLNHHWLTESEKLYQFAKSQNINIDLIIGGHEHSPMHPDYTNNIYYPLSFARAMYKIDFDTKVEKVENIKVENLSFIPDIEQPIVEYENKTCLTKVLSKRLLNLPKTYSEACPLGTFISDKMKEVGHTDIAFHSTGFTMYSLKTCESKTITKYDLMKVMCASSTLEKIEITTEQLLKVFENAGSLRMYNDRGNARFLQCSQNVKITGKGNEKDKTYKIVQIEINGEKLLNENSEPIDKNRIFTCTIDPYIGSGEQNFEILKDIPKTKVLTEDGTPIKINDLFYNSVICENKNPKLIAPTEYPSYVWTDI